MDEIQQLRKQVKSLKTYIVVIFTSLIGLAIFSIFIKSSKVAVAENTLPVYEPMPMANPGFEFRVFDAPTSLDFCGEQVPLQEFEVRERYDFEALVTVYRNSATILGFKRANRWFPVIEPILAQNGIPDDFKYLAVIESNLANAISPANAVGFWQFLDGTGRQYGLEIRDDVDERYSVEKSTEAACRYLKDAYKKFGNWTLAAASYNMGMAGLNNQITSQKVSDYYQLKLNQETSRYILRLVFTKELFENSGKYGYSIPRQQLYPVIPTRNVAVNATIPDLVEFARQNNTTFKLVKELNPWLRKDKLTVPGGKSYTLKLPAEGFDKYDELLKNNE